MSDSYIQIPPDSTGKAIKYNVLSEVAYVDGTIAFNAGDPVTGVSSGVYGTVVKITGTTSSGILHVYLDPESGTDFIPGEALQIDGITHALVSLVEETIYLTPAQIMGRNPFNVATIDNSGALSVRYAEGPPQLDSFGLSRTTTPTLLDSYTHVYEEQGVAGVIWQTLTGTGGESTYIPEQSVLALDVTSTNGSYVIRQTNKYHTYQPGSGLLIEMTINNGDSGKDGSVRRWGYYNDDDGIFFQLSGTTFSVVQRSSTGGGTSPVDEVIDQADFNGDHADGAGDADNLSEFNLELDKFNLYWIDLQWLGAGVVRCGVYSPEAGRLVLHTFKNPNNKTTPWAHRANLPIRYEIFNTSTTSGPSRISMACAAVKIDGEVQSPSKRAVANYEIESLPVTVDDEFNKPVISFKPSLIYGIAGEVNRRFTNIINLGVVVRNNPVTLRFFLNTTLNTPSWISHPVGSVDFDMSSTSFTGGLSVMSWVLDVGAHNLILPAAISSEGFGGIYNLADGSGPALQITMAGKCIPIDNPSDPTSIVTLFNTLIDFD